MGSMLIDSFKSAAISALNAGGEAALYALFPDNYELYLVILQVVDDDLNEVKDYLVFPVNPDSIMRIQKTFTNIKKSFSSVHVIDNNSFVPFPISMNGSFGRGLRTVFTGNSLITVKTGFGVVTYLKNLITLSKKTNENGRPYRTVLYNLTFGETYTVEVNECRYSQSMGTNRIWNYDLNMTTVSPGDIGDTSLNVSMASMMAFKTINESAKSLLKTVGF